MFRHIVGVAPGSRWGLVEKRGCRVFGLLLWVIIVVVAVSGHGLRIAPFAYRHVVFLGKVGWIDVVAVGDHGFVFDLLLWCVVDSVVPLEVQSLDREAVFGHARYELIVDDVAQHGAVAVDEVLEDLEVSLRLREAATVLDGHGLSDDELRQL